MRNVLKAATLESKFPLMAVEHGCIVSKDADLTVAYRVDLPEIFTVTTAEYEAIHSAWAKAVKALPVFSIVHRQDWFIEENYQPEISQDDLSFLSRSFERHFNERPYLNHTSYLFLTKTTKERSRQQSNFNALTRGFIVPKEIRYRETAMKFLEAAEQFGRIINDSGFVKITRLTDDEIIGTADKAGIVEKYFSLSQENTSCLQDMSLLHGKMKIGDNHLCLHTLSDPDDLPSKVGTDSRYERLSTDRSDCRLSFAAPLGVLLSCNHIYNQYLFIDDSAENLKKFEKQARNMYSLSRYSRCNQINRQWIEDYLNEAHSYGLTSVRAHCNVMAWADNLEDLKRVKNDVGSQLALMECKPRHNTVDTPTLFWAGIPGNAGDFPSEECFYTFIENALCFFIGETNYKSSLSPFGLKMVDRLTGKPLHLDISDLPMKKGVITNRNKFVLGPSGSGKSFFTNHLVRQYYEQGTHVLIVDTGNSYQGLCDLIHNKTGGEDGIYLTYKEEEPIAFNPFYTEGAPIRVRNKYLYSKRLG
jgi:conjugation system TraG family ATPase